MTRFQLEVEYDYDFDLIGISSHIRDYRLCWAMNNKLSLRLAKEQDDIDIRPKKKGAQDHHHPVYRYQNEEDHVEYLLIVNKDDSSYLVPEYKHADYFLLLRNNHIVDIPRLIEKIKEIDQVLTCFKIDVSQLKSKENLIF